METIYLDNASTTFPKPQRVSEAVSAFMTGLGCNVNRGGYGGAYRAEELVYETREALCTLFGAGDCRNVVFTKNVTESLNVILKGFLKGGDHVIVSSMEHNAVMRPLVELGKMGISLTRVLCSDEGVFPLEAFEASIRSNTRAVVITHASNVCGTLMPLEEIGRLCKKHGLRLIVDCAQTAGVFPISMERMEIDALAFTGHKGLLGPQGIGGFLLRRGMEQEIAPLISGGTGSASHLETMPMFMPDKFEAGTPNLPGIAGLHAGVQWIGGIGMDRIREHELQLTEAFLAGLAHLEEKKKIRIVGKRDCQMRSGVVSIQTLGKDMAQAAYELDHDYGIMTRVGLHCAPSAHKTLGTFPQGTIRFSFGWFNTMEHVARALDALQSIG